MKGHPIHEMPMYVLHYAPDNASLVIRLMLEEIGAPYRTVLVDRATREQDGPAYRKLNPQGLIPVLETDEGPIFETAAILLWLSERHGALAPQPGSPDRGALLKWLFFLSNTVHAELRQMFYTARYTGPDPQAQAAFRDYAGVRLMRHYRVLDDLFAAAPAWLPADGPSVVGLYLCALLRWSALYPAGGTDWFDLTDLPALLALARRLEARPSMQAAVAAEGLGPTPFSAPHHATPPEGTAL